jgi:hypothetical protein
MLSVSHSELDVGAPVRHANKSLIDPRYSGSVLRGVALLEWNGAHGVVWKPSSFGRCQSLCQSHLAVSGFQPATRWEYHGREIPSPAIYNMAPAVQQAMTILVLAAFSGI